MYRPQHTTRPDQRRGVILLVVITLLTLFAVVGLTFVYYAEAEATASRIFREAREDPELVADINFALGQLIYDPDDSVSLSSGLRGWSLARSMYGQNDYPGALTDPNSQLSNRTPYNGVGRVHFNYPSPFPTGAGNPGAPVFAGQDDQQLINFMYFQADPFVRYPEKVFDSTAKTWTYTGGLNAPYTYPDLNNLFLAAVKGDGTVMLPSYHRPDLFGSLDPTVNPNWYNAQGKYLLLRPRPYDQLDPVTEQPLVDNASPPTPAGKYAVMQTLYKNKPNRFWFTTDMSGDVKNLSHDTNGSMDSVWVDLGFPVQTLKNGVKVKPLFAFLVRDLDSLINVNQHGNARVNSTATASGNGHASNHGFGKWEINPGKLYPANAGEFASLLSNRYGTDGFPGAGGASLSTEFPTPPFYGSFDLDAVQWDATNKKYIAASESLSGRMPTAGSGSFSGFPTFPGNYENGSSTELLNHPELYNYSRAGGFTPPDRAFNFANIKQLLYAYGGANSQYSQSQLYPYLPNNLANAKVRNLLTTLSADLDRIGAAPYILDASASGSTYQFGGTYATGAAIAFSNTTPGSVTEYNGEWRSTLVNQGRLNLSNLQWLSPNKVQFIPYPTPDAMTGLIDTTDPNLGLAVKQRQDLAAEIYKKLRLVTGALDPSTLTAGTPEYNANRWLAQLAVNIVDYLDPDSEMTPFNWFGGEWVFGTEMPHLVVNEVYAQLDNDPDELDKLNAETDVTKQLATKYRINLWAELLNPLPKEGAASGMQNQGQVKLLRSTVKPYRLVINQGNPTIRSNPANVKGDPDGGTQNQIVEDFPASARVQADVTAGNFDINVIRPVEGDYGDSKMWNKGFYVVGPVEKSGATVVLHPKKNPKLPTTAETVEMSYVWDAAKAVPKPTILLRRLACEALPPDDNATIIDPMTMMSKVNPLYNPYVTTDYVENIIWRDARDFDDKGPYKPPMADATRGATGREQPYAAEKNRWIAQDPVSTKCPPDPTPDPKQTLYRHNARQDDGTKVETTGAAPATLKTPFDWLVHLDRPMISPMELLHVSGFKPHELTQQFATGAAGLGSGVSFQHQAPWRQNDTRIARFLEHIQVHNRAPGISNYGRVPGRININTIWDLETFQAWVDQQGSSSFTAADVDAIWTALWSVRTPNGIPGSSDKPFKPFTSGYSSGDIQYPIDQGVQATLLRNGTGATPLFEPSTLSTKNPYLQTEVLRKIYNSATYRSNAFAVWCTIGYFQVVDDTATPVKVGAEFGPNVGGLARKRFFAVVDRTNLSMDGPIASDVKGASVPASYFRKQGPMPVYLQATPDLKTPQLLTLSPGTRGNFEGVNWSLTAGSPPAPNQPPTAGSWVTLDVGTPNQELVQVWQVDHAAGQIRVQYMYYDPMSKSVSMVDGVQKTHSAGCILATAILGNPGPQPDFNYTHQRYAPVVRYFNMLD